MPVAIRVDREMYRCPECGSQHRMGGYWTHVICWGCDAELTRPVAARGPAPGEPTAPLSTRVRASTVEALDRARGDVSRCAWIRATIEDALQEVGNG